MSSPGPTSERRTVDERRGELIEAAVDVVTRDGLARTTTRAITDRADLALGAFHYAFRSKDDLLEAVVERLGDDVLEVLRAAGQDDADDLIGLLDAVISRYWTSVEQTPTLHLALHELVTHALREPRLRPAVVRHHARQAAVVSGLLESIPHAPVGTDRDDLVRSLLATLEGLVLQALVEEDPAAARRRLSLQARSLEAALGHGVVSLA